MLWPTAALAHPQTGAVTVLIVGLPVGERPAAVLSGPGVHRSLAVSRDTLRRLRPGRYTLTLSAVSFAHRLGGVLPGAFAYPRQRRFSVRVKAGAAVTLTGVYGSVINPGVVSERAAVLAVAGNPAAPDAITLAGHRRLHPGSVLSVAPGPSVPRGVLERVQAVSYAPGRTRLSLAAVSIYSVMPVANFDIALQPTPTAAAGDALSPLLGVSGSCTPDDPVYRRIENIRFSGGWNTVRVFGVSAKVGVRAQVDFDADAGISDTLGLSIGGSCELDVSASGMAGPIPVTAGVFGRLSASVNAGLALATDVSVHVQASASTVGVPPLMAWLPGLSFSKPTVHFSAGAGLSASAGIAVGVKAGLGDEGVASATVNFDDELDFSAQPGRCSWDAKFGAFSAEGELLGWDIETPKTPPLYTRNLWSSPCRAGGGSQGNPGGSGPGSGEPGGLPSLPVSPLGPTSGPRGFGLRARIPACPATFMVELDGQEYLNWSSVSPSIIELQTLSSPSAVAAGAHRFSFICFGTWTSPGFSFSIAPGDVQEMALESNSATPGGSFVLDSGTSDGPKPCPTLPGFPLVSLSITLRAATATAPTVSQRVVPMPDNQIGESLPVPASLTPGYYLLSEQCRYSDPSDPEGAGDFSFDGATVTVS